MIKYKRKIIKWITIIIVFGVIISISIKGMNEEIPVEEQEYINEVLKQITTDSTKDDVIKLLGEPSRDLGLKVNWEVNINGNISRVGVYFDIKTEKVESIVLDGGKGRFYYREDL